MANSDDPFTPKPPTTGKRPRPPLRVAEPDARPEILLDVNLERMIDQGIGALSLDSRVYQRGGQLVGVVTVPEGPARPKEPIRRAAGAPVIRPLQHATVRERLAASAQWLKFDGRSQTHKPALPPESVISGVIARGEWLGVRPLVSVVTSPCLRADGTVLQDPGYDPASATLYWPRESYFTVIETPTLEDARGAIAQLREVVCDFPFASPAHESAWIAGLFTMLARPAISGPCPLFAVDATTRGTGKSRLVDAAVRIATGGDAARTSLPKDDDEMRKRITSLMLEGDPAICLDNITRSIALPSLDAVLTATVWKDRLLGATANVTAPARAVWWATGNNLDLGGDLARRTLHIRLESPLENPEERTGFQHPDLLRWVDEARRKLVAQALTVLRAFHLAGSPQCGVPLWGSFEEWSRLVPPALVWAGMPDPMGARATNNRYIDEGKGRLVAMIEGLALVMSEPLAARSFTTKELISFLYVAHGTETRFDEFRDAVEGATKADPIREAKACAKQLGNYLRTTRGRVVQGRCIDVDAMVSNVARWSVQKRSSGST